MIRNINNWSFLYWDMVHLNDDHGVTFCAIAFMQLYASIHNICHDQKLSKIISVALKIASLIATTTALEPVLVIKIWIGKTNHHVERGHYPYQLRWFHEESLGFIWNNSFEIKQLVISQLLNQKSNCTFFHGLPQFIPINFLLCLSIAL